MLVSDRAECPLRPRLSGAGVGGKEEEGEGRAGAGRLSTWRSCIIQQLNFRARLFPGSGSLLQTLFMGQSGSRGGRAVCCSAAPSPGSTNVGGQRGRCESRSPSAARR